MATNVYTLCIAIVQYVAVSCQIYISAHFSYWQHIFLQLQSTLLYYITLIYLPAAS